MTAAGFALLMVLLLDKHGDYRPCLSLLAVRETERLLRVTIAGFLLALPVLLAVNEINSAHRHSIGAGDGPIAAGPGEMCRSMRRSRLCAAGEPLRARRSILGTGAVGRSIFSTLVQSPKFGLDPVAFIEAEATIAEPVIYETSYQRKRQANVLPGPVTPKLLRRLGASVLIIAGPDISPEEAAEISSQAEAAGSKHLRHSRAVSRAGECDGIRRTGWRHAGA